MHSVGHYIRIEGVHINQILQIAKANIRIWSLSPPSKLRWLLLIRTTPSRVALYNKVYTRMIALGHHKTLIGGSTLNPPFYAGEIICHLRNLDRRINPKSPFYAGEIICHLRNLDRGINPKSPQEPSCLRLKFHREIVFPVRKGYPHSPPFLYPKKVVFQLLFSTFSHDLNFSIPNLHVWISSFFIDPFSRSYHPTSNLGTPIPNPTSAK